MRYEIHIIYNIPKIGELGVQFIALVHYLHTAEY